MKYFVFFLLLIGISSESFSQLNVGIKAGAIGGKAVYDDTDYDNSYNTSIRPGILIGSEIDLTITKVFSINGEFSYFKNFVYVTEDVDLNPSSIFYELNYLQLPILLQANLTKGPFQWYILFGPSVNYWLGGNIKTRFFDINRGYDELNQDLVFKESSDIEKFFVSEPNRFQLGLQIGLGFKYPVNQISTLKADLRYATIHSYLSDEENPGPFQPEFSSNFRLGQRYLSINVAYMINIKNFLQQRR